jgi:Fic family protein
MLGGYKWEETSGVKQLLIELEAVKLVFNSTTSLPHIEDNLRRKSLLKSAVFSARIEGIPSSMESPKKEGQNLVEAYKRLYSTTPPSRLDLDFVRELHRRVLKDIHAQAGNWRDESWAVFDQSGAVVHLAPAYFEVPDLMKQFIEYTNNLDSHVGIKAAVAQFIFEKIHPFADGNGRVGRLISAFILQSGGYGFRGLAPFEEYIESHRPDYYRHLEPSHTITGFIEFFLEALVSKSREIVSSLSAQTQEKREDTLFPRRREIYELIKDHPYSTFDFIHRRFHAINPKTLHYDIQQLQKQGLIKKIGVSRGAVYST